LKPADYQEETGLRHVAISGGVWQNMRMMRALLPALEAEDFIPLYHRALPTNDACVSLGQVMGRAAVSAQLNLEEFDHVPGYPRKSHQVI
jgi:hydrogenase maturation factor HypF (carbamoyltransferase family)